MTSLPFVGRRDELSVLRGGTDDTASLYPIIGPSGIGKSALLEQYATWCEENNIPVVEYRVREPNSVQQFCARLLQKWQETHPEVFEKSLRDRVSLSSLASVAGQFFSGYSKVDPQMAPAGAALQAIGDNVKTEPSDEVPDFARDIISLISKTDEHFSTNGFVLIIDQFDQEQLDTDVYRDISRILRSVGAALDKSKCVCVGAQERFYDRTKEFLHEIELEEFNVETVRSYLEAAEFPTEYASEVYEIASGNPYFTTRILQIASQEGDIQTALEDHPDIQEERYERLENRFFESLDLQLREVLKSTCVLPELRPDLVAYVLDRSENKIESTFRQLRQQTVLKRLGYDSGLPVYQLHQLQKEYLKERIGDEELVEQHRKAAAYHLTQLVQNSTTEFGELLTEEGRENVRRVAAAGILFDYHIQRLPTNFSVEDRIDGVLDEVESIPEQDARMALKDYYSNYAMIGTEIPHLDVSRDIDSNDILAVLRGHPSNSGIIQTQTLLENLKAVDSVSSGEADLIAYLHSTLFGAMAILNSKGTPSLIEFLQNRLETLEESDIDDNPLIRLSRLSIIYAMDYKASTEGIQIEYDFWEELNEIYSLSKSDWEAIKDSIIQLLATISDADDFRDTFQEIESVTESGEKVELGDPSALSRHGIQGGLSKATFNPVVAMSELLSRLSTGDEIQDFRNEWETQITQFEHDGHDAIAALYRDIDNFVLAPLSLLDSQVNPALNLISTFNHDELAIREVEPTSTLIRALVAYRQAAQSN